MKFKIIDARLGEFVARMFYLAWKKSKVFGMGALQDRGEMTEEDVIWNIAKKADYPRGEGVFIFSPKNGFDADYVFGRMMKLYVLIDSDDNTIESRTTEYDPEYQSFSRSYPTFRALVEATAKDLDCKVEEV